MRLCNALEVSVSGYYDWLGRPESKRSRENRQLTEKIKPYHHQSREIYGSPKIHEDLLAEGEKCQAFDYQTHAWNAEVKTIDPESLHNLPSGVGGQQYQWVDLYKEGLSDVLTEQADGLYFKQNLGSATFAETTLVSPAPSIKGLASGAVQIQDLEASGYNNVVAMTGPAKDFIN